MERGIVGEASQKLNRMRQMFRKGLWEDYFESSTTKMPKNFDSSRIMSFKEMEEFALRKESLETMNLPVASHGVSDWLRQ